MKSGGPSEISGEPSKEIRGTLAKVRRTLVVVLGTLGEIRVYTQGGWGTLTEIRGTLREVRGTSGGPRDPWKGPGDPRGGFGDPRGGPG